MSFGPFGQSSGTANEPIPVDRSGVKVSPRPATAPPPCGRDGVWLLKPMSRLIWYLRGRRVRVPQKQSEVDDRRQVQRVVLHQARIVRGADGELIPTQGGTAAQRLP